jgi:hypothetical protein
VQAVEKAITERATPGAPKKKRKNGITMREMTRAALILTPPTTRLLKMLLKCLL